MGCVCVFVMLCIESIWEYAIVLVLALLSLADVTDTNWTSFVFCFSFSLPAMRRIDRPSHKVPISIPPPLPPVQESPPPPPRPSPPPHSPSPSPPSHPPSPSSPSHSPSPSSPPHSPSPSRDNHGKAGMKAGAIVGVVIGVSAGIALVVAAMLILWRNGYIRGRRIGYRHVGASQDNDFADDGFGFSVGTLL